MTIIGIDPGSIKTGYAVLESQGTKVKYIQSGVFSLKNCPNFASRLQKLSALCRELCQEFSPFEVAMEALIYVKNVQSLSKLAQARGALIASLAYNDSKFCEYAPNLVKSTVTGYGHSDKKSVEKSLRFVFGNELSFQSDDESDALAIAYCHHLMSKNNSRGTMLLNSKKSNSLKSAFKGYGIK